MLVSRGRAGDREHLALRIAFSASNEEDLCHSVGKPHPTPLDPRIAFLRRFGRYASVVLPQWQHGVELAHWHVTAWLRGIDEIFRHD